MARGEPWGPSACKDFDLFAVQPHVSIEDYTDEQRFVEHHNRLAETITELRGRAAGDVPALAVWPEYVATFLLLAGRRRETRGATKVSQVLRRVVLHDVGSLVTVMLRYHTLALTPAVITMLSPPAHRIYVRTFSGIAKKFGLWVVAGSGLFPRRRPGSDPEELVPASAAVFNTSFTFDPSGAVAGITRKVNLVPTQEDVLGISAAQADEFAVLDTPIGRLGTLICYDGFREPHTSSEPDWRACAPVLDRLGATIVAQPSANAWAWDGPWVFNEPGESQLRSEQWFSEGLASQLSQMHSIRYVVNPQLVGSVLDSTFEAPSLILSREGTESRVLAKSEDPRGEDILHVRVRDGVAS